MWHLAKKLNVTENGDLSSVVDIPADSKWFAGHFPNDPVLPGIAQIGMVQELLEGFSGCKVCIHSLSRIRFKKIIRPGDQLILKATTVDSESYSFSIMVSSEIVCNGNMKIKKTIRNEELY